MEILLSNSDNTISNVSNTTSEGTFKMTNIPEDKEKIAELNSNTVISYNLNIPTKKFFSQPT